MKTMKIFRHIISGLGLAALLAGSLLTISCDKSHELSNDNKNKPRPTIQAQTMKTDLHDFTIALLPSSDSKYYGCVILAGSDNPVPTAFDLVTGNVTSENLLKKQLYDLSTESAPSIKTQCTFSEDYQVFSASINENGLLSKVDQLDIHIDDASPSTTIKEGVYKLNTGKYSDVINPRAGESFDVKIKRMAGGAGKYILYANWFNIADEGLVCPPYLVGTVDYEAKEIIFDGTRVNSEGVLQEESGFGAMFLDYDATSRFAFWGGGDEGKDPITISFGDSGYLLTISKFYVTISDKDSGITKAIYDGTNGQGNETFTFVRE